jgi:hypothetical protein
MTPDEIAYLQEQAKARGYNPADLLKVIQYESRGDAARWGGKGGNYLGLIQFGGPERKQFGVDTEHPNARNQVDATMRYLSARGFKPGMGLLDLYSTINAGSPGHYNASDRPGMTVASHVAAMGGGDTATRPNDLSPGSATPPSPAGLLSEPQEEAPATRCLSFQA